MTIQQAIDAVEPPVPGTDPNPPALPVTPAPEPADALDPNDTDHAEMLAAQAALRQEQTPGNGPQPQSEPAPQATPAEPAPAAATPEPQPGQPQPAPGNAAAPSPMVPLVRLNEEVRKRQQLEQQLARMEGENAVLREGRQPATAGQPEPAPQQTQKTAQELISDLRAQQRQLAAKFQSGDLDADKWEEQRQAIDDQILDIRMADAAPAPQPQPQGGGDLALDMATQAIEEDHPYVKLITSDTDWQFIHRKAVEELTAEGINLPPGKLPARQQLILREKCAVIADRLGPTLTGIPPHDPRITGKPATQPPANQPNGQTQTTPALSPQAAATLNKVQQAQAAPPDANRLGSPAPGDSVINDKTIETMSDEEIAALPEATRARFIAKPT